MVLITSIDTEHTCIPHKVAGVNVSPHMLHTGVANQTPHESDKPYQCFTKVQSIV